MNLATFLSVALVLSLFFQNAEAKFPLNVFKGVSDCLSDNKKYLSPTIGMAGLDGGVMENIRFYGNFEAAYRQTKEGPERDYANDRSDDPVWQLVRLLFPSTSGQLSGDSAHHYNFGKHVKDTRTVALLINYTDDIRSGKPIDEEQFKNDLMASMGFTFKNKMSHEQKTIMAKNLFTRDKSQIDDIFLETQRSVEEYGIKTDQDQRRLGEAKNSLLQSLAKKAKRISNPKITAIFMDEIRNLYGQDSYSHPKYHPNRTPLAVKPAFFHHVLAKINQAKMIAEDVLNHTSMEDLIAYVEKREPKQKFIIHFKEETLTPLLGALKEAILTEKPEDQGFYPLYTPEQTLLAFLAYKFSTREDIQAFLTHLKPELINAHTLSLFDPSDLLTAKDLGQIANKKIHTVDDILALSTADLWAMPTPYRWGAPILNQGNTDKYDRKTNSFVPGTFVDCVEISIRHLINCFLYDFLSRQFNFKGLAQYHVNHPLPPAQKANFDAFMNFYKIQSVDLANDGSLKTRSQWNRVLGDLNAPNEPDETKIRYLQGTNELDAGFINLMKIFHKVLGIQIKTAPLATASLDDKKKWLEESFKEVFKALNPHEGYSIRFDMAKVRADDKEISGTVTISVLNTQGMLYSFDFRSDPDRHGQLENYRVSDHIKVENYTSVLEKLPFKGKGAETAILLLTKSPQLRRIKNLPAFYQWFETSLTDNEAKIGFLTNIDSFYKTLPSVTLPNQLRRCLKNIIIAFNLDDVNALNKVAPVILRLLKHEEIKDFVIQGIKSMKFGDNYSRLNPQSLELIIKAIQLNSSTLISLNLKSNNIGVAGATALSEALKSNTTLSSLQLGSSNIGVEGTKILAETLKSNTTLSFLGLYFNNIGVEGAKALAEMLKSNTTLSSLQLRSSNIGDVGVETLAQALKSNTTLSSLLLELNNIGVKGAKALAEMLKSNTTLSSLQLGSNNIGVEGAEALAEALKLNTTLSSLQLGSNDIGDLGAIALGETLRPNTTLSSLQLGSNNIGDPGAIALAETLKSNTTLSTLLLEFNNIGNAGATALGEALKSNTTLSSLELEYNNSIGYFKQQELIQLYPGRIKL